MQNQIIRQMQALIRNKQLRPGSPVPSSRELSKQLHVSRNTVAEAYADLVDEGYLCSRRAIGTFISDTFPEDAIAARPGHSSSRSPSHRRAVNLPLPYTGRGKPGLHRPIDRALNHDFSLGKVDSGSFPAGTWRRLTLECLGGAAERISEYNDPAGLPELRQLIANYLGPARGMVVSPEQILIVGGCQQGMNLAAHLFLGTNTPVVVEAPCYRGAAFLFESYGARIIPVPVDDHGLRISALPDQGAKLACITPSHQFPTGVTLSMDRRLALLDWASRHNTYVLEVDYDADFRYEDSPLPSLYALDRAACTLYMSSFSHAIGPGLRLGYMVVPRNLIQAATTIKALTDNGQPWLEQAILAQFIREGGLLHHLKRIRQTYRLRRDALIDALHHYFPGSRVTGAESGSHVVWHLPPGLPPAEDLKAIAHSCGIGVYPLDDSPSWFHQDMADRDRILLLGYTVLTEQQINAAMGVLQAALADQDRIDPA
nr:PLP-dependent aminotransferase family protein [Methylonatrum kenyense]